MAIALLYDDGIREYDFGPGHPFRGDRYERFARFMTTRLPPDGFEIVACRPASDEDLRLICDDDYVQFTTECFRAANLGLILPGRFSTYHSADNAPVGRPGKVEEAARLVVGQAKKACNLVQSGAFEKAVSIGGGLHHAKRAYGEGFCLYNDVAFCATYLVREHALERVLILDTDAHAGNGTAEYFYDDPRVLLIDLHQDPRTVYPGTGFAHQIGQGRGAGFTINVPMPIGADCDCYALAFDEVVEPVVREFRPQIIIRNGGSDPHFADGLTALGLSLKGFTMIGERVRQLSLLCRDRSIDLIASGYNEELLPRAWLALIFGLAGIPPDRREPEELPDRYMSASAFTQTERVLEDLKSSLRDYWSCLRS